MSKNYQFNPFYVQKFFALNIISSKSEPGGRKEITGNVVYLVSFMACFITAFFTIDKKAGELRYNFISQMRFCVQLYASTINLILVFTTITTMRSKYVNAYHGLINQTIQLQKINVQTSYNLIPIVVMYIVVFVSTMSMFAVDIYTFESIHNISVFISHYFPSLATSVYIISISALYRICTSKYVSINEFLKSLTKAKESTLNKYYLSKQNKTIKKLFDLFPGEECTIFQKIFKMLDELTKICRLIDTMCGFSLLVFMAIVTIDILSFVYDICMDISMYVKGNSLPARTIYAVEYWPIMSVLVMMFLISASSGLMDHANSTKVYLHQLRNLYPQLHADLEMFSMQLQHSELDITAARFFTIHRGILYNLLSAWITYMLIFVQLDTDISIVDETDA